MNIKEQFHRTFTAVECLIVNCYEAQAEFQDTRKVLDRKAWLKEYCIAKVCGPRQSGHSEVALQILLSNPNSIFLAPKMSMMEYSRERVMRMSGSSEAFQRIGTLEGYIHHGLGSTVSWKKLELITVDCSSFIPSSTLQSLIGVISANYNERKFCLLLLQ